MNANAQCEHPDYEALMEFYDALNGPNWIGNNDWHAAKAGTFCDLCDLKEISCSFGRITVISMNEINIKGNIPDLNIENLKVLHIRNANFSIQDTLSDFSSSLIELEISNSNLNGKIPDFSNLPRLNFLSLIGNELSDTIPNFTHVPDLVELRLFGNRLEGSLPQLDSFPFLERISVSNNLLEGRIPEWNLPNLKNLYLSSNNLVGNVPEFKNTPKIQFISISDNNLEGNIPNFSESMLLKQLKLNSNNLSDTIPDFKHIPLLTDLSLSDNNLIGKIPNFSNLANLVRLELDNNQLSDNIPDFQHIEELAYIDLSNNQLSGPIPVFNIDEIKILESFYIHNNNLSGCYPDYICDLTWFNCEGNDFLPQSGNHDLFCFTNSIQDQIGTECGGSTYFGMGTIQNDCSCLIEYCESTHPDFDALMTFYHDMNGNEWIDNNGWNQADTGVLCDPCVNNSSYGKWYGITCNSEGRVITIDLDGLDDNDLRNLEGNNLSGTISQLELPFLQKLILTGNDIFGPIPNLDHLQDLEKFGGSFNAFTGTIPELKNNTSLIEFRCSYNALTGQVPDFSQNEALTKLTCSNNLLEGCIPNGICDLELFSALDNYAMPWQGNHENYCQGKPQLGAPCINADGMPRYINENCDCTSLSSTTEPNKALLKLFPNPTHDELTIKSEVNLVSYLIYNSDGRLIKKAPWLKNKINIKALQNGIYFVRLVGSDKKTYVKRIVKI